MAYTKDVLSLKNDSVLSSQHMVLSKTKQHTITSHGRETWSKDILGVRTMQSGTNHCTVIAVVPLSKIIRT